MWSCKDNLISTSWLEKRKPYWTRLEQLLDQSTRKGFRSLGRSELQELGLLYREIAADLAGLREDRGSVHFARYLNQLLARAHNIIYSAHKTSPSEVLNFFVVTYPQIFRRNLRFVQVAFLIFDPSAAVGAVITFQDPDFKLSILGPSMVQTIEKRDVDPFYCGHQTPGLQRHHDQQHQRGLCDLRPGYHGRSGHH